MIIIGLGSNIGDRLSHLKSAIERIRLHPAIDLDVVSPVYMSDAQLPADAPAAWNQPYLNTAVRCRSRLDPVDLLDVLKVIEADIGRQSSARWSPRCMDCDILFWDGVVVDTPTLAIPHKRLFERPFMLWPLMDLFQRWEYPVEILDQWGSRFDGNAPFHTRQLPQRVDGGELMGIVNITMDSFSDGGLFVDADAAVAQSQQLFYEGATIIDLGAESTRPGREALVTPQREWARLEPVIQALTSHWDHSNWRPRISVDTRHATTAQKAIEAGVDWINDVSGFQDPAMMTAVACSAVRAVCMHSLSIPPSPLHVLPRSKDPLTAIKRWGFDCLERFDQAGVDPSRVILDPGIGFGKSPHQNIEIIRRCHALRDWPCDILVGHSRKSFHQLVTGCGASQRDMETAIGTVALYDQGINYIRVHDVGLSWRAIQMHRRYQSVSLDE